VAVGIPITTLKMLSGLAITTKPLGRIGGRS
jgi:hypothetical protein